MKLSVIIPTYNRISELKYCLQSILRQKLLPYEILVIDNSSENFRKEVRKLIDQLKPLTRIELIYLFEKNKGVSFCRNTGIAKSHGDIIAFTDDDCIVDQNWCRNIIDSIKKNPHAIIVGNYYDGELENIYSYVQYFRIKRIFIDTIYKKKGTLYCRYIDTKNFALTRNLVLKHGLRFDTVSGFCKYSACEDLDFSNQAKVKNIPLVYNDQVLTSHKGLSTLKDIVKREFSKGRAFYHFKLKWSDYKLKKSRLTVLKDLWNEDLYSGLFLSKLYLITLFILVSFIHKLGIIYERLLFINKISINLVDK